MMLIAICTCQGNADKRRAVRDTWLPRGVEGIEAAFFMGRGEGPEDEEGLVMLDVPDDYDHLPAKVMAYFRHALAHSAFDWIFKCDDDTYVDVERLRGLACDGLDLVGSAMIWERGAPSGGAGYLLSRRIVERLVREGAVPDCGDEDVLIGREAMRLGAVTLATARLWPVASPYPRPDNDLVTAHYLGPERMRAVHTLRHAEPVAELAAEHPTWRDSLLVYENGVFARRRGACAGLLLGEPGRTVLHWFDWGPELLVPPEPPPGFDGDPEGVWRPGIYRVRSMDPGADGGESGGVGAGPEIIRETRVEVCHSSWCDTVILSPDGSFTRQTVADGGTFVLTAEALVLCWDRWPPERFVPLTDPGEPIDNAGFYHESVADSVPCAAAAAGQGSFHCVVSDWTGPVTLENDGTYYRGRSKAGTWSASPAGHLTLLRRGREPLAMEPVGSAYEGDGSRIAPATASFFGMWREFDPRMPIYRKLAGLPLNVASPWGDCPIPYGCFWDMVLSGENPQVEILGDGFRWWSGERMGTARWFVGIPRIDSPRAFHLPLIYDFWCRFGTLRPVPRRPQPGLSFVANNTGPRRRIEIARQLARWFPLMVSSGLKGNFSDLSKVTVAAVPRTLLGKLEFISDRTFNLCFENAVADGYLTEKPFEALWAGTVPVYEGDPGVGEWIDPSAMIDCTGLEADEIADRIREAERNGVPERVWSEREKLMTVGLDEMASRFGAFLEGCRHGLVR